MKFSERSATGSHKRRIGGLLNPIQSLQCNRVRAKLSGSLIRHAWPSIVRRLVLLLCCGALGGLCGLVGPIAGISVAGRRGLATEAATSTGGHPHSGTSGTVETLIQACFDAGRCRLARRFGRWQQAETGIPGAGWTLVGLSGTSGTL